MRVQKSPEEILEGRIKDVTKWQPALLNAELFFRAGTYFFAHWRGKDGLVIGTCSKKRVFGKVVSDTEGAKLLKLFRKRYKKLIKLQRIGENKEVKVLKGYLASYKEVDGFILSEYVSCLGLYQYKLL